MADNFGTGVSRVLDPKKSQIAQVVWQQDRPPLDSELSGIAQFSNEMQRLSVSANMPSGWIGNGINDIDAFVTNPTWSNWFRFGQQKTGELAAIQWANVNGWIIPVTGTQTGTPPGAPDDSATWNRITLNPPPNNSGDNRVDFVFLEVWQALLPPNPGSTNKPSASTVYKYGNVESGMSFLPDESVDPSLGFETTQRIQTQYRIRVVTGLVGLTTSPDGFDPASVKARGAAATDTAFTFTNMRQELGDPGLWRAGTGVPNTLGTVDGYSYAIPLAVVFRRNTVAWDGHPGQNLNGGFTRNPSAVDRTGWKTFSTVPTLASPMTPGATTATLVSATNIPLPATPASAVYIKIGDEVMTYTGITGTTVSGIVRGQLGSKAEAHPAAATIEVLSGRPDGLFADQIAKTDIMDARHIVSPNGFDYNTLLQGALDQTLRGTLRANWKRSGSSPIGTFLAYQDLVSASSPALGVSKLDAPNGIRSVWSDASVMEPVEFLATPPVGTGATESINTSWGLQTTASPMDNSGGAAGRFAAGKSISIPIAQFKTTIPGSDADQVSFPLLANTGSTQWVKIRVAGTQTDLVAGTDFTVTTPTGPSSNLVITFVNATPVNSALVITFHVQYGAGRGLSHRPDAVHSIAFTNATAGTYLRQKNSSTGNVPISTGYAPLWSKFRKTALGGLLPVTAESYVDPGSKTVVLTPFRQIALPLGDDNFIAIQDNTIHSNAGVMPNPSSKWGSVVDPLNLFSTVADTADRRNTFMVLPRSIVPGWGEVHAPIIHTDAGTLVEGLNYMFSTPKGTPPTALVNFVAFGAGPDSKSFDTFTTVDLTTVGSTNTPAIYNELSTADQGAVPAGMRKFVDTSGLGRQGLELPPFYGPSRLWAVYEAADFHTNGSAYDPSTRAATGTGAKNLLRQDFEGATLFITLDADGDSTFVLNAEALDMSKSPNAVTFSSGNFVMEMNTFGFDRGTFDPSQDARIVLARERVSAMVGGGPVDTSSVSLAIPAPPQGADSVVVNYSRTPYQFGGWVDNQDTLQLSGPLSSADANQIGYTEIDEAALNRPNQKVFEVLASTGFVTTLGTGRLSADFDTGSLINIFNPGWEEASNFPPASAVDARPLLKINGALGANDELVTLGTEFSGATTRLPMGALFRDKDFRGEALGSLGDVPAPLLLKGTRAPGLEATGIAARTTEHRTAPCFTAPQASGGPGEIIVHVDGNSSNYALLTNFRTTRGGSAFNGRGGELSSVLGAYAAGSVPNTALAGVAYLVRNTVTNIGASEVSAGGEIMLVVATTAVRKNASNDVAIRVLAGTNGSAEGFSAVDYCRISGHPLVTDGVRQNINPSTIALSHKKSLKPRIGG